MKKLLLVATMAAVLAGCLTGCNQHPVAEPGWYTNATYFDEKNGLYEEMPIYPNNIVLVGDDYIDRGLWNEFYGDTTLKNRGITYDATEHVLYRIGKIAAQHPAKIFVSAGYNDLLHGTSVDTVTANIRAIFDRIAKASPKTKCYYLNIVLTPDLNAEQTAAGQAVNQAALELSRNGKFEVIDIDAALREGIASGAYSWDEGKYLNGAGYEALAQAIERQIGKPHQNHAADKEDALEVSDYYKHRVSVFRSLPETENQIIMLGNSLINNGPWAELFPLGLVVNRGISGDVAMGVDQRLEEIVADKPSKVFLITGTNDLINEPELPAIKLWDRYEKLIKDIREQLPETELYVQSMLPLNPKTKFYAGFNDRAAELNKLLDAGAGRYGYYFIDIASKMTDENGDLQEECTTDGIHLSAIGYFKWAAELARGNRMMHSLKKNLPNL